MGDKEYVHYLSPTREDRLRYLHTRDHKRIIRFIVQYEAFIADDWRAIVRYDTAHGRPHKDVLHPDGTEDKQEFFGYAPEEVLTLGERDIRVNWPVYRVAYEREMRS